jgi:hypothetical protein
MHDQPKGMMGMAPTDNTVARTLHDVGLAAWFGGSLMGAAGVNGAAAVVEDPTQRLHVANTGWARWTPLNLVGIAAHLIGGAVLTGADKSRLVGQQGVARAQRQLTVLQWVIPVLTGAVLVVDARMGEQQRPTQVTQGLLRTRTRSSR